MMFEPGDWITTGGGGTGIYVGTYFPSRPIDFQNVLQVQEPGWVARLTGYGRELVHVHTIHHWTKITCKRRSPKVPSWLEVGRKIAHESEQLVVRAIRGRWVLVTEPHLGERNPHEWPDFIGIFDVDELGKEFDMQFTRLERIAFDLARCDRST